MSSPLAVARVCPSGEGHRVHAVGVAGEGITEAAGLVPVGQRPTAGRCCRRWRWPGCARRVTRHRLHAVGVAGEGVTEAVGLVRVGQSHSRTVLSVLAVARVRPSGETPPSSRVGVAGEGVTEAAGLVPVGQVPQQHGVVAARDGGQQHTVISAVLTLGQHIVVEAKAGGGQGAAVG